MGHKSGWFEATRSDKTSTFAGNVTVSGDLTTNGSLTFGDAAADTLTVTGLTTVSSDQKIQFRDTGLYIHSPADGKLKISADGTGADDITLSGAVTISDNVTFGTDKGFASDVLIDTDKKIEFRDSGIYINSGTDGKLTISADGTGNDDITLSGTVVVGGGVALAHISKDTNYTTTADDCIVGVDSTGGAVTITLGSASVAAGKIVVIKDAGGGASSNNITIDTEGSETIDGSASTSITSDNGVVRLYSDGTNWFII